MGLGEPKGEYDTVAKEIKVAPPDSDQRLERGRQHWLAQGYEVREQPGVDRSTLFAAFDGFNSAITARKDQGDIEILGSGPCYE